MSQDLSVSMTIKKDDKYKVQEYNSVADKDLVDLFNHIRNRFQMEPALGEVMVLQKNVYFTARGCSRLAEQKHVKDIRFEYLDPRTFNVVRIQQQAEDYIIVKCFLTKEDNGVVEGQRALNIKEEMRLEFPKLCNQCGFDEFYKTRALRTKDPMIKLCPRCNGEIHGFDMWKLKDYMNFTETKAFMRAVGKAYNVNIFEDLDEDAQYAAQDIGKVIPIKPISPTTPSHILPVKATKKADVVKKEEQTPPTFQEALAEKQLSNEEIEALERELEITSPTEINQLVSQYETPKTDMSYLEYLATLKIKEDQNESGRKTKYLFIPGIIERNNDKSMLFKTTFNPEKGIWIPKSQIKIYPDDPTDGIWASEWILKQKEADLNKA